MASIEQVRARAQGLEKEKRHTDALALYAKCLADDPTDLAAMKRCIGLRRAAGEQESAHQLLVQVLSTFPVDTEAWLEAADMAMSRADLETAAFALEEVLLAHPENHHVLTRYAEVLFTQGSTEQRALARQYFGLAVELAPHSLRALYGLHLCVHAALQAMPRTAKDKERNAAADMLRWTSERIAEAHKRAASSATTRKLATQAISTVLVSSGSVNK